MRADALVLLTALAHARTPLSVDDLAGALGWPLDQVQAALGYAHAHPGLAGPMALRRVPPQTYTTLTPRLDILAVGQHQMIRATTNGSTILAEDEAIVLLGALAYGHGPRYATFRDEDPHRCRATVERHWFGATTTTVAAPLWSERRTTVFRRHGLAVSEVSGRAERSERHDLHWATAG